MKPDITGTYSFTISKEGEWYIAKLTKDRWNDDFASELENSRPYHAFTQGRTEEEIYYMVSDAFACMMDVECSLWNRLVSRLMIYR